jgi:site-specific recombinase XerD
MSIHNVERRLKTALKHLEDVDITTKNKEDIKTFLTYIAAHGCQVARQCKYIYPLQNIAKWLNKDYMEVTKKDIEAIVKKIMENKDYTAWTKQDYMVVIKKFYKWLYNHNIEDEDDWEIPTLVKFIKIRKPKESKTIPSDLLTPKDVRMLADQAKNLRERALILSLYETGARIGELLNLKVKDVEFDSYGAKLKLFGKTGPREVRIIGSAPAISEWLAHDHPKRNDKNSFLFCNIRPENKAGTQMSYAMARKLLKQLEQRSGINKNLRPHLWRHARCTELAEHLSDSVRCKYFGWVQGSDMSRIYTHLADTDKTILEMNGLIEKEKDRSGKFTQAVCPRCKTKNSYGAQFCSGCSLGLDEKSIMKYDSEKDEAGKSIQDVLEDPHLARMTLRQLLPILQKLQEKEGK